MKIFLCEGDGFLHGGETQNIIVKVTLDSGKEMQFPYVASKTLSELYSDVSQIADEVIVSPPEVSAVKPPGTPAVFSGVMAAASAAAASTGNEEIGKEDLVKCVKVEDRGEGATVDIVVGGIYRVLKVLKSGGVVDGKMVSVVNSYDLIDDNAPTPRRIFAFPHEVVFYKKRKSPMPKVQGKIEELFACPVDGCGVKMVAYKEPDGRFRGTCWKCNFTAEFEGVKNAQPVSPAAKDLQPVSA